jgi:plastocyanin
MDLGDPVGTTDSTLSCMLRGSMMAVGAVALAFVASCGGGDEPGNGPEPTTPPATATTSPGEAPGTAATITITGEMTEFAFELSETSAAAGDITFSLTNSGEFPHAMTIEGGSLAAAESSEQARPGGSTEFTVSLEPGEYTVWCPVGNHRGQGMETTFTVK